MILKRTVVKSTTSVVPGVFATANEFMKSVRAYRGGKFYVIPAIDYAVACAVEREAQTLHIKSTIRAKNLVTFDNKIGTKQCILLPPDYVFHFNYSGLVIGVTKKEGGALTIRNSVMLTLAAHLEVVPKVYQATPDGFVAELVHQIQDGTAKPWNDTQRIGFYIGDSPLKHTNSMALTGIVVSILSPAARLRLKCIWTHSFEYTETVFWLELRQASEEVYAVLSGDELTSMFLRKLGSCL